MNRPMNRILSEDQKFCFLIFVPEIMLWSLNEPWGSSVRVSVFSFLYSAFWEEGWWWSLQQKLSRWITLVDMQDVEYLHAWGSFILGRKHNQELGVMGMWEKQVRQCIHEWKHRTRLRGYQNNVYTRIEIRVGIWHMPRMLFDEVWVWCSVQGLFRFHSSHGGKVWWMLKARWSPGTCIFSQQCPMGVMT